MKERRWRNERRMTDGGDVMKTGTETKANEETTDETHEYCLDVDCGGVAHRLCDDHSRADGPSLSG
jgi:hypothetical protein